jgi:hypothetical protein
MFHKTLIFMKNTRPTRKEALKQCPLTRERFLAGTILQNVDVSSFQKEVKVSF